MSHVTIPVKWLNELLDLCGPEDHELRERVMKSAAPAAPAVDAQDAARYRWLRDTSVPPHNFYLSVPDEFKDERYSPREVDAAIDAAIAAQAAAKGAIDD